MHQRDSRLAATLAAGSILAASASFGGEEVESNVDDAWFRAWLPASIEYSFPAKVRGGGAEYGDIDTLEFRATYIHSAKQSEHFNWLLGADWQRIQTSVPDGAPLPNTIQSTAAVVGFDWFFHDRWRARLEVMPGVYSDFDDFTGDDFNAPFSAEVSYTFGPNLLVGGQFNVNARRDAPVLGAVGVRWKLAEDWLLSLWFPRPRLEYFATDDLTLYTGATIVGGTFVVADDFGTRQGRPELDGEPVDFQEVRVGGGVRYAIKEKLAIELSGGWSVERRYNFRERDLNLESDGAPYVQIGFGLKF